MAQDERELGALVPVESSAPAPGPQEFASVQCGVASAQLVPSCWVFFGAMSAS